MFNTIDSKRAGCRFDPDQRGRSSPGGGRLAGTVASLWQAFESVSLVSCTGEGTTSANGWVVPMEPNRSPRQSAFYREDHRDRFRRWCDASFLLSRHNGRLSFFWGQCSRPYSTGGWPDHAGQWAMGAAGRDSRGDLSTDSAVQRPGAASSPPDSSGVHSIGLDAGRLAAFFWNSPRDRFYSGIHRGPLLSPRDQRLPAAARRRYDIHGCRPGSNRASSRSLAGTSSNIGWSLKSAGSFFCGAGQR